MEQEKKTPLQWAAILQFQNWADCFRHTQLAIIFVINSLCNFWLIYKFATWSNAEYNKLNTMAYSKWLGSGLVSLQISSKTKYRSIDKEYDWICVVIGFHGNSLTARELPSTAVWIPEHPYDSSSTIRHPPMLLNPKPPKSKTFYQFACPIFFRRRQLQWGCQVLRTGH